MQNNKLINALKKSGTGFLLLLFFSISLVTSAQESQLSVKGKVVDDTGLPLPGATIVEAGTTNGVVTDFDGNFQIEVSGPSAELNISYMGYQTQTVAASDQFLEIKLLPDTAALEEVVIIGYGESKQKDLTGSISAVDLDDLQKQPAANIGDALQGRAAGVRVITSGQPGANPTIRIRGTGTINNNDPLVVVDGVPLNGGLNQVNMNDVASMQVLKDASSTAIYGARGANGVVIITTKRGNKSEGGQLNVEAFSAIQTTTDNIDVLNAQQFATLNNEMLGECRLYSQPCFCRSHRSWKRN